MIDPKRSFSGLLIFVEKNRALLAAAIVALTLAAGLLYSIFLGPWTIYPDEQDYLRLAHNLAHQGLFSSDGVHSTAYRPPGYPALLVLPLLIGAEPVILRFLQFGALCINMLLVCALLPKRSGVSAILAMLLVLLYPIAFYTAGTFYPQTMASTLFLAALVLVFRRDPPTSRAVALAGILMGCLILTVPVFVFTLLYLVAWLMFRRGPAAVRRAALLLATASLVVAPWLVRNGIVFHSFVFVSTNAGINLVLGNSENTSPNSGTTIDISRYETAGEQMGEIERDRYFARVAADYLRTNKMRAAVLYAGKFLNYFNYRNRLSVSSESSRGRDLAMLLTYGSLLLICFLRLMYAAKVPLSPFERFALVLYVVNGAVYALFFTRIRFRLPFDYLLIIVAASFLARLFEADSGQKAHAGRQDGSA